MQTSDNSLDIHNDGIILFTLSNLCEMCSFESFFFTWVPQYYNNLFTKHKGDIKKTWQTISDIICKSNGKRKTLDKIIVDSRVIKDKEEICNKFNDFFANIGPKLANQIKPISNKTYDTFLKKTGTLVIFFLIS